MFLKYSSLFRSCHENEDTTDSLLKNHQLTTTSKPPHCHRNTCYSNLSSYVHMSWPTQLQLHHTCALYAKINWFNALPNDTIVSLDTDMLNFATLNSCTIYNLHQHKCQSVTIYNSTCVRALWFTPAQVSERYDLQRHECQRVTIYNSTSVRALRFIPAQESECYDLHRAECQSVTIYLSTCVRALRFTPAQVSERYDLQRHKCQGVTIHTYTSVKALRFASQQSEREINDCRSWH